MRPDSDPDAVPQDTEADAVPQDTGSDAVPDTDIVPMSADTDAGSRPVDRRRRRRLITLGVLIPILVVFALLVAWYLANRKPLSGLPGLERNTPHYAFSIYGATHPLGVAVARSGDRIYVTQSDGARVVKVYDRSGKRIGELKPPASTGPSHVPVYVAVNPTDGDVYVSDRATAAVYIYDEAGKYLRSFAPKGKVDGGFTPLGLAFDSQGRLYTTDVSRSAHRVLIFGKDGSPQGSLGRPGQLSFPNGVVVDSHGNVAVSDSNNGRLVVFAPNGQVIAMITRGVGEGDLGLPRGTAIGDGGRLYVVDTSNHAVRVYRVGDAKAPSLKYIGSFGEEGTIDGRFEFPNGIATDGRARVYVTDRENNRVQVWNY